MHSSSTGISEAVSTTHSPKAMYSNGSGSGMDGRMPCFGGNHGSEKAEGTGRRCMIRWGFEWVGAKRRGTGVGLLSLWGQYAVHRYRGTGRSTSYSEIVQISDWHLILGLRPM